jgi:hypothetical protein
VFGGNGGSKAGKSGLGFRIQGSQATICTIWFRGHGLRFSLGLFSLGFSSGFRARQSAQSRLGFRVWGFRV